MKNLKLVVGTMLALAGLIFSLLPHEVHELITFGLNLNHYTHHIISIMLILIGLASLFLSWKNYRITTIFEEQTAVLRKIKIPIIVLFLIIGFLLFKLPNHNEVIAQESEPDYHKLQQIAQEQIGVVGEVKSSEFDPMEFLTTWNFNNLPPEERKKYYKESKLPDGRTLREYWISAEDKEIEIAPGVFFPAWTYNGQVPAPTIRATEGDLIRIHFQNKGSKPHTMHFHGFHTSEMDGSMTKDFVLPGQSFTYEFEADPFGVHLFHCHSVPLEQHISKGLCGAYIVDPKNDTRPKPDKELVMVMNGFDTNFDKENEVYAVNTVAFYYVKHPIKVKVNELVRIYLINILEFDQINSFHLHATFFDEYRTGTSLKPNSYTDTVVMGQGERSVLDVRFRYPSMYMFHAHKTEFAEKGWMGFFEVEE